MWGKGNEQYQLFTIGDPYEFWSLQEKMHNDNEITDINVGIFWDRHYPNERPFRIISMTAKTKPSEMYDTQTGLKNFKFSEFSMMLNIDSIEAFAKGLKPNEETDVPVNFQMDGKRSFDATVRGRILKFYSDGEPNLKVELTTDRTTLYFKCNKRLHNWDPPKKPCAH